MILKWKFISILYLLSLYEIQAIIIRRPVLSKNFKLLDNQDLPDSLLERELMTYDYQNSNSLNKNNNNRIIEGRALGFTTFDFFTVIVAVFIGLLIGNFVINLFQSEPEVRKSYDYSYSAPKGYGFGRKLRLEDGNRNLTVINKKIKTGEGKLASYINQVLLNNHNVLVPKNKLFRELKLVKKYFSESGFNLPSRLTERKLYQITKNVFWNLHHFNMEKKQKVAYKAIHALYSHRETLFNTFMDSIRGI